MRKLKLPFVERIIGFTIPDAGEFYICDNDEVWRIVIGVTPNSETIGVAPYEFAQSRTDFLGLVFSGLSANEPIMRVGQNEVAYDFDPKQDVVEINYRIAGQPGQIDFPILSGDWFAASFSKDGGYLVFAEPYEIALYEV